MELTYSGKPFQKRVGMDQSNFHNNQLTLWRVVSSVPTQKVRKGETTSKGEKQDIAAMVSQSFEKNGKRIVIAI